MTTVAVTGGTGFIGSVLLNHLVDAGYAVRALARRQLPERDGVTWVPGDLADERALGALVDGAQALVHGAGVVRGASRRDFDPVNVEATLRLAQLCAGKVRLLYLSSLAAREPTLSHYAASKAAGETALAAVAGLDYTILRPPAVYGPGDVELKPLLEAMWRGFGVFPDHSGRFALLYVDDLARAILAWLAASPEAVRGRCFELDDGRSGYDWSEVIAAIEAQSGRRVRAFGIPRLVLLVPAVVNQLLGRLRLIKPMLTTGKVRELFFEDWAVDATAAQRALGWQPRVNLSTGLALTLKTAPSEVPT